MKGNKELIDVLNTLLAKELTAVNQYMVHAEICDNWGYEKLHKSFEKRAIEEMKHAKKLISRIIFLEGIPIVSELNKVNIGSEVTKQLSNDHSSELEAVKSYNKAILLSGTVEDFATREMLESILLDEDKHVDEIEESQDQIKQMTLPIFLSCQVE